VAAADIGQQILKQVAVAGPVPHVMMRVDDRQIGLDDLLAPLVEPILADRRMAAGRDRGLRHWALLPRLLFALPTLPRRHPQRHGFDARPARAYPRRARQLCGQPPAGRLPRIFPTPAGAFVALENGGVPFALVAYDRPGPDRRAGRSIFCSRPQRQWFSQIFGVGSGSGGCGGTDGRAQICHKAVQLSPANPTPGQGERV
jgi:hypothetical protein